jgi:hypothetical protein
MKDDATIVKVFTNETEFNDAYERFLASLPRADDKIIENHERMETCFRDYLDAFEKWIFCHAYASGYAAAMSKSKD